MASVKEEGNDADPSQGGEELNQKGQSKMSQEVLRHGAKSIVEGRDQEDETIRNKKLEKSNSQNNGTFGKVVAGARDAIGQTILV